MSFVGNLPGFPAVKEFRKSVKNWQNYRHEFGVLLFGSQCTSIPSSGTASDVGGRLALTIVWNTLSANSIVMSATSAALVQPRLTIIRQMYVFILITFFIIRKFASISLNRHYVSKTRAQGNTSRRPMQQRVVLVALCVCSKITRNGLVIGTIDFIKVKKLWFIHYLTATDTFTAAKNSKRWYPPAHRLLLMCC